MWVGILVSGDLRLVLDPAVDFALHFWVLGVGPNPLVLVVVLRVDVVVHESLGPAVIRLARHLGLEVQAAGPCAVVVYAVLVGRALLNNGVVRLAVGCPNQ